MRQLQKGPILPHQLVILPHIFLILFFPKVFPLDMEFPISILGGQPGCEVTLLTRPPKLAPGRQLGRLSEISYGKSNEIHRETYEV